MDISPPYRRNRHSHRGGKMVFVRALITKRLENLEAKLSLLRTDSIQ